MRVLLAPTPPDADRTRPATLRRDVARVLLAVGVLLTALATAASAQTDPTVAPVTTILDGGLRGTDGTRTLVVSQAVDLDPAGQSMSVSGSGYDDEKGIYVALCVIPPVNFQPTPCGGGVDTEGTQGAAQWISSNPPEYGVGLAQPYGPGGSLQTTFNVKSEIAPGIDCLTVRCAIVTRNDHTRSADRSQDIIIPVTFKAVPVTTTQPPGLPSPGGGIPPTPGPTNPPAPRAPAVPIPPLATPSTTLAPPPTSRRAPDGLSASDGARTLSVTQTTDLDPESQVVIVSGRSFDASRGIYVSLCAIPEEGAAPGPCRSGAPEVSRWVSSNPPEYGVGVATPYTAEGNFDVDLTVAAVIDTATDCRTVACAIVARADDTTPDDRSLDLLVPVSFAAVSTGTSAPSTSTTADEGDGDETEDAAAVTIDEASSGSGPIVAVVVAVLVLAAVGAAVAFNARRRSPAATGTPGEPDAASASPASTPDAPDAGPPGPAEEKPPS